jgi:hypothetical protein
MYDKVVCMTIWNILRSFGIIYDRLVEIVVNCFFQPSWYVWTTKNLATQSLDLFGTITIKASLLISIFFTCNGWCRVFLQITFEDKLMSDALTHGVHI